MEHGFILRTDATGHRVYMVSEAVCRATASENPTDKTVVKRPTIGFVPVDTDGCHLAAFLNRHLVFDPRYLRVQTKAAEEEDPEDVRLPMEVVSVVSVVTKSGKKAHFNKKGYPSEFKTNRFKDVDKWDDESITIPPKSQLKKLPDFIIEAAKFTSPIITVDYDVEKREVYVHTQLVIDTKGLSEYELFGEDSPLVFFK